MNGWTRLNFLRVSGIYLAPNLLSSRELKNWELDSIFLKVFPDSILDLTQFYVEEVCTSANSPMAARNRQLEARVHRDHDIKSNFLQDLVAMATGGSKLEPVFVFVLLDRLSWLPFEILPIKIPPRNWGLSKISWSVSQEGATQSEATTPTMANLIPFNLFTKSRRGCGW